MNRYWLTKISLWLLQIESQNIEVDEDVYNDYLSIDDDVLKNEKFCYRSYFIVKTSECFLSSQKATTIMWNILQNDDQFVATKESTSMISQGTTGLTTWQVGVIYL